MNHGSDIIKAEIGKSTGEIECVDWQVDKPARIVIRQGRAVRAAPVESEFYQPVMPSFDGEFEDFVDLVKSYQPT